MFPESPILPPKPKNKVDYFFHYSDRYRSGSFDIRTVVRWQSEGDSYYQKYILKTSDGDNIYLNPNEFYEFEKKFNKL